MASNVQYHFENGIGYGKLPDGTTFVFDEECFDRIRPVKWYISLQGGTNPRPYLIDRSGRKMHTYLIRCPKGYEVDHISLDTLDPALFAKITARDEFAAVQAGIHAALESGIPVKLNCVPQVGVNEGELEALAALAQDKPLQVRFIEMMPIGYGAAMPCISGPELLARFRRRWPELAPLPGAACAALGDGPAVYYTVPGWKGDIGFIAAVHGKFCASCNRVRLTSQGFLRPCLASETGCDLRTLLRGGAADEELLQAIRETIWSKPREHHFGDNSMPATRGMYRIGG